MPVRTLLRAPGIKGLIAALLLVNLVVLQLASSDSVSRWVADWQDARIETVLRRKIAPLLAELEQARDEGEWNALVRKYQDLWRVPVDLVGMDSEEIENWHRLYLDKQGFPVVLIDSFQDTALIRVGEDRVIIAGAFVESAFWKHLDYYLLFAVIALGQILVVLIYQRWLGRRLGRLEAFLACLARGGRVQTTLSDPRHDHLAELTNRANDLALQIQNWQQQQEVTLTLQRELLHGVAHELRGPMARIQFALELLRSSEDPKQCDHLWQQVEQAQRELDGLVAEVLQYARIRAANFQLHCTEVDLGVLLEGLCRKVQSIYPRIRLERVADTGAPRTIRADERQLGRAWINLMRNAARYAASQVLIRWMRDGDRLVLLVEDDGPGIPESKHDIVFEPFTRLDDSRSKDSGGAGLGLAIARGIIERHHGTVRLVDGELGGACFRVELPLQSPACRAG